MVGVVFKFLNTNTLLMQDWEHSGMVMNGKVGQDLSEEKSVVLAQDISQNVAGLETQKGCFYRQEAEDFHLPPRF